MRAERRQAELIGRLYADIPRDPQAPTPEDLDGETAEFIRAVAAVERGAAGAAPPRDVAERIWQRALAEVGQAPSPRPTRRASYTPRPGMPGIFRHWLSTAALVAILVLGGGFWASPGARAGAARLACLIPGLGIRACDTAELVMAAPASTTRDGATLTVSRLVSTGGETSVRVEIVGLPAPPPANLVGAVRLSLADSTGGPRAPLRGIGGGIMVGGTPMATPPATFGYQIEAAFARLDPSVRTVEVRVDGPPPVGSWRVQVPVVPLGEAALAPAREGSTPVTLHGIAVRVSSVAADGNGLAVQLTAQADPAVGVVRGVRRLPSQGDLVLRDDRGGQYAERRPEAIPMPADSSGVLSDGALFPPVPADIRAATLTIPFVVVQESSGEAALRVPVIGRQAGDRIAVADELMVGPYRVRLTDVTIAQDNKGNWRLWFTLDLGDWSPEGRKLASIARIAVDGEPTGCGASMQGDVSQEFRRCVALPHGVDRDVTVTFRDPVVAVRGPWELDVPLPIGR